MRPTMKHENLESWQVYEEFNEPLMTEAETKCLECGVKIGYDESFCKECAAEFRKQDRIDREKRGEFHMSDYVHRVFGF